MTALLIKELLTPYILITASNYRLQSFLSMTGKTADYALISTQNFTISEIQWVNGSTVPKDALNLIQSNPCSDNLFSYRQSSICRLFFVSVILKLSIGFKSIACAQACFADEVIKTDIKTTNHV